MVGLSHAKAMSNSSKNAQFGGCASALESKIEFRKSLGNFGAIILTTSSNAGGVSLELHIVRDGRIDEALKCYWHGSYPICSPGVDCPVKAVRADCYCCVVHWRRC
jgi:hypothetical protein